MEDENLLWDSIKIIIFIALVFELIILGIAFIGADEVNCNFLWCEFKSTRSTVESNTYVTKNCYQNGIEINCSDIDRLFNNN